MMSMISFSGEQSSIVHVSNHRFGGCGEEKKKEG